MPGNGSMRKMIRLTWKVWVAWQLTLSVLYVFVPSLHTGGFFTILSFAPVFAIILATRSMEEDFRAPWLLMALGQLFFALGDLVTYNYEHIFDVVLPFPSMGDVFYQLTYPFMLAAVALFIFRIAGGRSGKVVWPMVLTIMGVFLAVASLLLAPIILGAQGIATDWFGVSYPVWDFCILVGLIHLRTQWSGSRVTPLLLMVGMASLM